MLKTAKLNQIETTECKICGLPATHAVCDSQGDKVGPTVYHCGSADCKDAARNSARFFIAGGRLSRLNPRSIEDAI